VNLYLKSEFVTQKWICNPKVNLLSNRPQHFLCAQRLTAHEHFGARLRRLRGERDVAGADRRVLPGRQLRGRVDCGRGCSPTDGVAWQGRDWVRWLFGRVQGGLGLCAQGHWLQDRAAWESRFSWVTFDSVATKWSHSTGFCEVPYYTFDVFVRPSVCDIYIN